MVRQLKGCSSRLLRRQLSSVTTRLPTIGTNLYFVSMVGDSRLAVINKYIENHKRRRR